MEDLLDKLKKLYSDLGWYNHPECDKDLVMRHGRQNLKKIIDDLAGEEVVPPFMTRPDRPNRNT